jgi:hypothetical protein
MFMYFEPLATEKAIATYHVMLFRCRMGGDKGDLTCVSAIVLGMCSSIQVSFKRFTKAYVWSW